MLYRVPGDPKTGYDLGVGTGTYGGYVPWVRTLGTGTMRVRCGYGTGTVRGYGVLVQCTHRTCFQKMWCYFQNVEPSVAVSAVAVRTPFCLLAQDRLKGYADTRCWMECATAQLCVGNC